MTPRNARGQVMDGRLICPQIGNFYRCHEALDLEDVGCASVREDTLSELAVTQVAEVAEVAS